MSEREPTLTEDQREVLRIKAAQSGIDSVILYVERIIAERERTAGARALWAAARARFEWQAEMRTRDEQCFPVGSGLEVDVCADAMETWLIERAYALAPENAQEGNPKH